MSIEGRNKNKKMKCPYETIECAYLETAGMGMTKECESCEHYDIHRIRPTGALPFGKLSKTSKVVISMIILLIVILAIFYAVAKESLIILLFLGTALLCDACWFIDLTVKKEL